MYLSHLSSAGSRTTSCPKSWSTHISRTKVSAVPNSCLRAIRTRGELGIPSGPLNSRVSLSEPTRSKKKAPEGRASLVTPQTPIWRKVFFARIPEGLIKNIPCFHLLQVIQRSSKTCLRLLAPQKSKIHKPKETFAVFKSKMTACLRSRESRRKEGCKHLTLTTIT